MMELKEGQLQLHSRKDSWMARIVMKVDSILHDDKQVHLYN